MLGEEATIVVGLEQGGGYQLQIGLRMPCGDLAGKGMVSVRWNGKMLERKTPTECGDQQLIASLPADAIERGVNSLRLSVAWNAAVHNQAVGLVSFNAVPSGVR